MNCLLYARVSTDKQAQKDLSIPAQIAAMKEYAKKNDWNIAGHFVEEGESARTANRPELKNLLQYCKEHKEINAVVVHKLDRMARNSVDYGTIRAILKKSSIRLISVTEQFEDNPVGEFMENIFASMSEFYSANLGEEIKKASKEKLNRGEWPSRPPFGYKSIRNENNRPEHVPNEQTAPLVRQAFELFSTGNYSLQALSDELYERGVRTKSGRPLSKELTKRMLQRKFYVGQLEWNDKLYEGKHKPIVSPELFFCVQEVLKKRSADSGEKGKLHFLLRGTAYCKVCGRRLTAEVHPRGSYYRCLPDFRGTQCSQRYTPVDHLDDQMVELYQKLQPPKEFLELLGLEMRAIADKRKGVAARDIKRLSTAIIDLENKEIKLIDEMLEGKLERNIYERMQKKYTEQKTQTQARLSQLQVDYDNPLDFLDKCIVVASSLLYMHNHFNFEHRKNLVKAVFERIEVEDKAIVSVKLTPPFSILLSDDIRRQFDNGLTVGTIPRCLSQISYAGWFFVYEDSKAGAG